MRLTSVRLVDKTLPELLAVARKAGFFGVEYDRPGRELRLDGDQLSLGRTLMENVRKKWRGSMSAGVCLNDLGLTYTGRSILDIPKAKLAKHFAKIEANVKCDVFPFELHEEFAVGKVAAPKRNADDEITVTGENFSCLSQLLFTKESQAECFMNMQRQRKIWWMKISANPGRIFATEMRNTNNIHHTSLCAKFSFGNVEMEKIECISNDSVLSEKYPTIIRSTVPLESATLGVVLDAIDAAVEDELCLDRTIAPFQCAVLCLAPSSATKKADLRDLISYVQMLLIREGISTYTETKGKVLCKDECDLNTRIAQMDTIGVPYVLLLSVDCLKQGFLKLRNRDTTLCETIHLSDVPGYLNDIFFAPK